MKYFRLTAVLASLAVGLWFGPALAQMSHRGGGGAGGPNLFFLMRAAQLTADQKTQVQSLIQSNRQDSQPLFTQLRSLRQQLAAALYSTGTADANLLSQINALETQLQQERLSLFQQVWSMLSSTQKNQVTTVYSQLQADRAQRESVWKSLRQQNQQPTAQ
jgi:polyhydroxyalkanoate synthesis regulator protein